MPAIRLPDGSERKFDAPVTIADVAMSIGAGLAKAALEADPKAGLQMGEFLFVERIAPALSKGNAGLTGAVNQAMAKLMADGGYATISQKWFKEDIRCK